MSNFIASSNFTKMLANLFVFIVLVAAVGLFGYDTLTHQFIPEALYVVIGTGLGSAVNLLGIHQGTSLFMAQGGTMTPPPSGLGANNHV